MIGRLKRNQKYFINFIDARQAIYTWYSGLGVFIKKHEDNFGERETHYLFRLPDGNKCVFPRSSVIAHL